LVQQRLIEPGDIFVSLKAIAPFFMSMSLAKAKSVTAWKKLVHKERKRGRLREGNPMDLVLLTTIKRHSVVHLSVLWQVDTNLDANDNDFPPWFANIKEDGGAQELKASPIVGASNPQKIDGMSL
jgi:hypothetical protein